MRQVRERDRVGPKRPQFVRHQQHDLEVTELPGIAVIEVASNPQVPWCWFSEVADMQKGHRVHATRAPAPNRGEVVLSRGGVGDQNCVLIQSIVKKSGE